MSRTRFTLVSSTLKRDPIRDLFCWRGTKEERRTSSADTTVLHVPRHVEAPLHPGRVGEGRVPRLDSHSGPNIDVPFETPVTPFLPSTTERRDLCSRGLRDPRSGSRPFPYVHNPVPSPRPDSSISFLTTGSTPSLLPSLPSYGKTTLADGGTTGEPSTTPYSRELRDRGGPSSSDLHILGL